MPKTVGKNTKTLKKVANKTMLISKKVANKQTKGTNKSSGAKVKSTANQKSKTAKSSRKIAKKLSNYQTKGQGKNQINRSANTSSQKSSAKSQKTKTGSIAQQQTIQRITNRLSSNQMMRRATALHKVVFVRHGQSTWNLENRFTGWHDVDLTPQGVEEAKAAGQLLKEHGFQFDLAHTSVLKRAIKTYNTISEEMGSLFIPHYKSWRLNERHYGALQGLNKAETAEKHGEEKVLQWRRSYDIPPPELALTDERHPAFDRRYGDLPPDVLPCTESLKITVDRVLPYWYDTICPQVIQGKSVVVVAHGNSLRAIVKYLAGMSEEEILAYNIPTACPLVFEFDENMTPIKNYYLLDEAELKARQEAVANQAKVRV